MIRAIIFDFDGTILDTESPDFLCWKEIYESHDCVLTMEEWAKCVGTTYDHFNPYDHLESLTGRTINRAEIGEEHRNRFVEMVQAAEPLPGIVNLIESAKSSGLLCAVASSSYRDWVYEHLVQHKLFEQFDSIKTREDVTKVKPDPELYRLTLSGLDVAETEAIAIEDSPNGALAAKRAGLFCVAVPNSVTRSMCMAHADVCLDTLENMTLDRLLGIVDVETSRSVLRP